MRKIAWVLAGRCWLACCWLAAGCGGGANVEECEPEGSCSCEPGTERATSCSCTGGSNCSISGDDIEFQCDGNAGCGLDCGTNCLVTCPGTTSCNVEVDDEAVVRCPGTAECTVTCSGSCTLEMAGNATSLLTCEGEADGADTDCVMEGCTPTECGDGVYACGMDCPPAD